MNKNILEFNNYDDDFVKWAKLYLVYKLYNLDTSKTKDNFDDVAFKRKLESNDIKTFDELHEVSKEISKLGLAQLYNISMALKKFFPYSKKEIKSLTSIDTNTIDDFVNEHCRRIEKLSLGLRRNYKNSLTNFFNFIDNVNIDNHKFNIGKIDLKNNGNDEKNKKQVTDWLDLKTITKFNKELIKYPFKTEFEKNRDILITRLFLFSGIEPSELASLKDENFILKDGEMILRINETSSRDSRDIYLPKGKMIVYFNAYKKERDSESEYFFYSPKNVKNKILPRYTAEIVKRLIEFTKVKDKVRDKTPSMLRKSFLIAIHNEKDENGFTQPLKNVQYISGIKNTSDLIELLKYHTIECATASNVFEGLNI